MTGTGTLNIYLIDENDNVPVLDANTLSMCLSDESSSTSISAHDLDLVPYSEPFHFEVLGEAKEKWTLDPRQGTNPQNLSPFLIFLDKIKVNVLNMINTRHLTFSGKFIQI